MLPGATNQISCNGRILEERRLLLHGDVLRVDSHVPGMMVTMVFKARPRRALRHR